MRSRQVWAWCLFDFANSSYTTLIVTVAFAIYFREAVVDAADNRGDRLWGIANFLAMLLVAAVSPFVGALADYAGRRKALLVGSTLLTVCATASLVLVGPGDVALGMALFVLGTVGFEAGYVFYNSFLPDVSTPATIGRISGWGWAVGYLGGLLSLLACLPLLAEPLRDAAGALVPSALAARRVSFLVVAAFYLFFALPAFLWLREAPAQGRLAAPGEALAVGFRRVRRTLSRLERHREAAKFVLASLFFTDGISTVISFSAIYATVTFGFSSAEVVALFVVLNVVAFPGALASGYLADRIGPRRTLLLTLLLWVAVVLAGALAAGRGTFWAMACGAAIGMGATQAVSRSFMAQISPRDREAEFFGFFVLAGKFAAMFGPLVFGLVSAGTGSQRAAVLSLLPFFLAGLGLVASIDEAAAIRDAERAGA